MISVIRPFFVSPSSQFRDLTVCLSSGTYRVSEFAPEYIGQLLIENDGELGTVIERLIADDLSPKQVRMAIAEKSMAANPTWREGEEEAARAAGWPGWTITKALAFDAKFSREYELRNPILYREGDKAYRLSDYPKTFVESIDAQTGDAASYIADMHLRPDEAPHLVLMTYHNQEAHFLNGRAYSSMRWCKKFPIGYMMEEVHVDEHDVPHFDFHVPGSSVIGDAGAEARWDWCARNCKGYWRAQAEERDVAGSSCMMLEVWFDDEADEAAFLAAFPGAAA